MPTLEYMETDFSRKELENRLCTLYQTANDFDGHFREQLMPIIEHYRMIYFVMTGTQYPHDIPSKQPARRPDSVVQCSRR